MTTKKKLLSLSTLLIVLILVACSLPTSPTISVGARAWVDQPETNALLPLAPFTIRVHASRPGGGIVKMSILVNSVEVGSGVTDPTAAIVTIDSDWTPAAPGVYSIQAVAMGVEGQTPSDVARVCVTALTDARPLPGFLGDCSSSRPPALPSATLTLPPATGTAIFTATPVVTDTTTPTDTATAQLAPFVIPHVNAFCRKGPGTLYDQVTVLQKGTPYNASGRNSQSSTDLWWLVQAPGSNDCWVGNANVDTQGPVETLAVVLAPPLPTPPGNFGNTFVCNLKSKIWGVALSWVETGGETGYRIYRNGALLTSVDKSQTTYKDINPPLDVDLVYQLEAYNGYGVAPRSSTSVPACK
jgi:hypothetical protein